jgi:hypothetical protein
MGAKAVPYLLDAVSSAAPDVVVLPIGGYVCTVGTVAESVRQRFGEYTGRLFLRSEAAFQSRTTSGRVRRRMNAAGRAASRRILGTRTLATVSETADIYVEILHRLARVESLQVIVVRDARFSLATQRRERRLQSRFDELEARVLPVAEQHHFVIADLEGALGRAPDRRVFHQDDGVHTTASFHAVYFEVLRVALAELRPAPA